ncbi:MAG: hypothetical protein RL659_198 [Pseudomonadota bacterium]
MAIPEHKKTRTVFRPGFCVSSANRLLLRRRQVGATAVRHFCRHADAFAQRGVWVDGFADVHRVCAHLDGQSDLANHVASYKGFTPVLFEPDESAAKSNHLNDTHMDHAKT